MGDAEVRAGPILVVDDDPKIVTLVRTYLEREGFSVVTAGDGRAALAAVGESKPRLIVLDIMLPELDGLALMRILRERSEVPIVLLSARGSTADRVYGIHEGADDYLVKPFSPAELVVRVKAVLRRSERTQDRPQDRGTIQHRDLAIDLDRLEVRRDHRPIPLTPPAFRLLPALGQRAVPVALIACGVLGVAQPPFKRLMLEAGQSAATAREMFDQSVVPVFLVAAAIAAVASLLLASLLALRLAGPLDDIAGAARRVA